MMRTMSSRRVLLAVLVSALGAVLATTLTAPAGARALPSRMPSYLSVRVPSRVPVDSRVVLRAHVRGDQSCTPYAACRTTPVAGTITWTLVNARRPHARFRHLSTVEDGRARWRTPRIHVRGPWTVEATYTTAEGQPLADDRTAFRVTRR